MVETNQQLSLKERVLAHYDRMIAYAEKQDGSRCANRACMENEIHESWYGLSCPLCTEYYNKDSEESTCSSCPVSKRTGHVNCVSSPWYLMTTADNWQEWIAAAYAERTFLDSLEYEDA